MWTTQIPSLDNQLPRTKTCSTPNSLPSRAMMTQTIPPNIRQTICHLQDLNPRTTRKKTQSAPPVLSPHAPLQRREMIPCSKIPRGKLWKFWNVLIKTRNTTPKACATTAITSMEGTVMPLIAPIPIDWSMPKGSARTAIWTTITRKNEEWKEAREMRTKLSIQQIPAR